jgi:hypothetical protein
MTIAGQLAFPPADPHRTKVSVKKFNKRERSERNLGSKQTV